MHRKTLATLVVVSVLALGGLSCAASRLIGYATKPDKPPVNDEVALTGMRQPVKVTFDHHHVPHIVAQNEHDLWFATGYIQARERLFQMDMLRRMASGRISELLGSQTAPSGMPFADTVGMDRFFQVMGLAREAEQSVNRMSKESLAMIEPYVAGVNAYIETAAPLPIEYRLIDEKPAPWTIQDVLTVGRLTSFQLSVNMAHELLRFLLAAELGPEMQQEIFPGKAPVGPCIIEREDFDFRSMKAESGNSESISEMNSEKPMTYYGEDLKAWSPVAGRFLELLGKVQADVRPYVSPAASNSWAVSGRLTKSGKPILANDPHLLHGAPATFYLMHLTAPGIDTIGATLPGTPYVTLGRNRHLGWSATNTFADVQDLYLEKLDPSDPGKYITPEGSVQFHTKRYVVRERTGPGKYVEHPFDLRFTRHGAVLNDALIDGMPADSPPIALKTSAVWPFDEGLSMIGFAKAKTVDEFADALKTWGIPIQNWIAVDDQGNLGYLPMGFVPVRKTFDGTVPVPGWTDKFEWDGYIPFDKLPKLINPPSGMIVTANNQVMPSEDYPWPYSIDTMQGYRAGRIRQMLQTKKSWDADEIRKMQTDAYAPQADRLLPSLLASLDGMDFTDRERRAFDALRDWDRVASTESTGASIFYATYREAWQLALDDDVPELFSRLVKVFSYTYGFFDRLWAESPDARVWDMKGTDTVEKRDDVLRLAFRQAVRKLTGKLGLSVDNWTWGKLHTITFHHFFGKSVLGEFDVGPVAIPGAWDTVWAAGFGFWDDNYMFEVAEGPALRHVMDFSKMEEVRMVPDLGQSGWPKTPAYSNGFDDWRNGDLWNLSMEPEVYSQHASGTIKLVPANTGNHNQ